VRAIVVDDEPLARRELRRLLAEYPNIEIIAEAGNAIEAAREVEQLQPDLLFLDVQMPGPSGFDLLERLEYLPRVIFTTAYDQHAVRAFEVNALDYLLKPIETVRLAEAVARAQAAAAAHGAGGPPLINREPLLERLFIREGARCWFVPLAEVKLMSAEGNYVRLFWNEHSPLLARPMSSLERRLDPRRFFRANRGQIINLELITGVELGLSGRIHVQLRDGPEVQISRRQARLFRQQTSV
jgi:two-component system, LytTR family, response regulator